MSLAEEIILDHEHVMLLAFSVIALLATVAALAHLAVVLVLMRLGSKVERALAGIHDLEQSVRGMLGAAVEVDVEGQVVDTAAPDPLHLQADAFARAVRERVARSGRGR